MSPVVMALGVAIVGTGILYLFSIFLSRLSHPPVERVKSFQFIKGQHEKRKEGMVFEDIVCLKITGPKGNTSTIKWDDVEEVHAFKRDLFSMDLICLAFKKMGKEEYYEINEDMVGFHDLLEILPSRFPGFNKDWYYNVALPPLDENHRILWTRPSDKMTRTALP